MRFKIHKSQYSYSISLVAKKENEEDMFCYMQVGFKKGSEPNITFGENVTIETNKFFLSAYQSKDGAKPKIVVMDYEIIEVEEKSSSPKNNKNNEKNNNDLLEIGDDDLPF